MCLYVCACGFCQFLPVIVIAHAKISNHYISAHGFICEQQLEKSVYRRLSSVLNATHVQTHQRCICYHGFDLETHARLLYLTIFLTVWWCSKILIFTSQRDLSLCASAQKEFHPPHDSWQSQMPHSVSVPLMKKKEAFKRGIWSFPHHSTPPLVCVQTLHNDFDDVVQTLYSRDKPLEMCTETRMTDRTCSLMEL